MDGQDDGGYLLKRVYGSSYGEVEMPFSSLQIKLDLITHNYMHTYMRPSRVSGTF